MWSKGTLYLAVFVALAAVLVAYYLYSTHKSESFSQDTDDVDKNVDKKDDEKDDTIQTTSNAYKTRVLVMRLFDTLLMRKASESEIEKYSAIVGEENIVKKIIRDYKVDDKAVAHAAASTETDSSTNEPDANDGDDGSSVKGAPSQTRDQKDMTPDKEQRSTSTSTPAKSQVESYADFLPFEEVNFVSTSSSAAGQKPNPLAKVRAILSSDDLLPGKSPSSSSTSTSVDAKHPVESTSGGSSQSHITIDKNELRVRLEVISREVSKLSQLLATSS
jgi:hypothetical protein